MKNLFVTAFFSLSTCAFFSSAAHAYQGIPTNNYPLANTLNKVVAIEVTRLGRDWEVENLIRSQACMSQEGVVDSIVEHFDYMPYSYQDTMKMAFSSETAQAVLSRSSKEAIIAAEIADYHLMQGRAYIDLDGIDWSKSLSDAKKRGDTAEVARLYAMAPIVAVDTTLQVGVFALPIGALTKVIHTFEKTNCRVPIAGL